MRTSLATALSLGLLVACQSTGGDTLSASPDSALSEPVTITMGIGGIT